MILHRTSAKTSAFSFFNVNYLTHRSKSCVEGFFDMSMSLHMLVVNYLFVPLPVSTVDFFVLLGASGGGLTRLSWPPSLFAAVAAFISLQWFMNFVTSWFQSQQKKGFRKMSSKNLFKLRHSNEIASRLLLSESHILLPISVRIQVNRAPKMINELSLDQIPPQNILNISSSYPHISIKQKILQKVKSTNYNRGWVMGHIPILAKII